MNTYKEYLLSLSAVFILLCSNGCSASEPPDEADCTFDEDYFSIDRYKTNPLVKFVDWSEQFNQAAIITADGDLVKIQHWSCRHYGVEARMYLIKSSMDDAGLIRKLNTLASISIDADEIGLVSEAVNTMPLSIDQDSIINFPSETYSEFYASADSLDDTLILTIKFYGN